MEAHARGRLDAVVHCGPVAVGVTAETPALRDRALAELEQFTAHWDDPCALIRVHLHATDEPAAMGEGRFLHCSSIRVDQTPSGLVATCRSGASGIYEAARREWDLCFKDLTSPAGALPCGHDLQISRSGPAAHPDCIRPVSFARAARPLDGPAPVATPGAEDGAWTEDNMEDLLELILTTAWREVGWIPLHCGAVVSARRCALLMAPAKGGKSTLTAAMLHRGWRTLGDDKLLIALRADGQPEVRGLTTPVQPRPADEHMVSRIGGSGIPASPIQLDGQAAGVDCGRLGRLLRRPRRTDARRADPARLRMRADTGREPRSERGPIRPLASDSGSSRPSDGERDSDRRRAVGADLARRAR